jgi:pantetheine-phosphate adenylyltransferase
VRVLVRGLRVFSDFEFEFRQALANKRMAPDIETMLLITDEAHSFLSGTTVREIASLNGDVSSMVPQNVAKALYKRFGNASSVMATPTIRCRSVIESFVNKPTIKDNSRLH